MLILSITLPIFVLILAGYLSSWRGLIDQADFQDGIVQLVRGANIPCALFGLGATLYGMPMTERIRETAFMVVMKLIACLSVVFLLLVLFVPGLDPVWRASTAVMASTVLSVLTMSALVMAFG